MAYETKDNTGSMFPNDRKESANHPDAKGSATIGGVEYWVSGWNKKTQEGKQWRSLSFTPKEQRQTKPSHDSAKSRQLPPQRDSGFDNMDSDVPF